MKAFIATLGLAATLANATAFRPNHWHYKRDNTTMTGGPQTTLTVIATEVHTVTSCAPTVTNCPTNPTDVEQLPEADKTTFVETVTRQVTTTVCPVSEAPAISSSIIASVTNSGAVPTGAASDALPEGLTSAPPAAVDEPTTTTTATTTSTTTSTVQPPAATNGGNSGNDGVESENTGDDDACTCPPAVTVTVTVPASTVYVTIGGDQAAPTAAPTDSVEAVEVIDEEDEDAEAGEDDVQVDDGEDDDEDADDDEEDCEEVEEEDDEDDEYDECEPEEGDDEEEEPEAPEEPTATTTPIPFPTGNGTGPIVPGPTGFARRFRL